MKYEMLLRCIIPILLNKHFGLIFTHLIHHDGGVSYEASDDAGLHIKLYWSSKGEFVGRSNDKPLDLDLDVALLSAYIGILVQRFNIDEWIPLMVVKS